MSKPTHPKINFLCPVLAITVGAVSPAVFAQAPAGADLLEEVVVTARKREESLLEVPLAVTALTSEELLGAGIVSLVDVVEFAPGVQFENNSVTQPGRIYTDIRFRGLGNELVEPFAQVGSVFLDGVPMVGGASSLGTENIERIEVVKGPSSALFGRSTFAGAVNYITKNPSLTEYSGRVTVEAAQDQTHDWSFAHEGPLVDGKVGYRVFMQDFATGGQYVSSSDGGALGEMSTRTIMGTLYAEPNDNLSIKFRGVYSQDDDGPPPEVHIGNASSRRAMGPNFANCFAQRPELATARKFDGSPVTDFICGEVPVTSLIDVNTQIISSDTLPYFAMVDVDDVYPEVTDYGLKREQIRGAVFIDYDFEGMTLSSVTSLDDERVNSIRDIDGSGAPNWVNYEQFRNNSFFQELRLTSASDRRNTWMVGFSYFSGENIGYYLNGGESVVAEDGGMTPPSWGLRFDIDTALGREPDGVCPCGFNGFRAPGTHENETLGLFGSFGFDFTEQLGLDIEWRYQQDALTQRDPGRSSILPPTEPFATGNGTELGADFNTFLPRVTLQFTPSGDTNVWATFSQGNNPGFFNSRFAQFTQDELDLNPDFVRDASLFLDEENLDNFEIGWKQLAMNGRANFSVVAYTMDWTNQKTRTGVLFNVAGGGQSVTTAAVQGFSTDLSGVEFEGRALLSDVWTLSGQFTISDARFRDFECGFTDDFAPPNAEGIVDCSGNTPLQFPDFSGSVSLSFADAIQAGRLAGWDYFGRLDAIHIGKQFTDEQNFSYIGSSNRINLRGGVQQDNVRIEVYVTNLFNDDQYLAGGRISDFSADRGSLFPFEFSPNQSLGFIPAKMRQAGARVAVDF